MNASEELFSQRYDDVPRTPHVAQPVETPCATMPFVRPQFFTFSSLNLLYKLLQALW